MFQVLLFVSAFSFLPQEHDSSHVHDGANKSSAMPVMEHADHHDHDNDDHDHEAKADDEVSIVATELEGGTAEVPLAITRTDEINAALANGGQPVVAEVLGVVCDFCAKAMNKTFGKRKEVSAVYVDLDKKTLNLVLLQGETLEDSEIEALVTKAGYRISAIHRGVSKKTDTIHDAHGKH